jgi:hypothetical protein
MEPVPFLANPGGVAPADRRDQLDDLGALNRHRQASLHDSDIATRIAQYELAFRMQTSVPELLDLSKEPRDVLDLYGPDVQKPGSFAWNAVCAPSNSLTWVGIITKTSWTNCQGNVPKPTVPPPP